MRNKPKAKSIRQIAISVRQKAKSVRHNVHPINPLYFLLSAFCFLLFNCSTNTEKQNKTSSPKFIQYYNQGEQLYLKNCSNCHQKDGKGLGRLYPPLNSSDYMEKKIEDVLCLIRFGKKGELIVNGISFNKPMPGVPTLTDLEIAEIATYIYNSWSHERGLIEVKGVTKILQSCSTSE